MEAASPATPAITDGTENTIAPAATEEFLVGHPHEQPQTVEPPPEPLPIATSGDLNLMPPSTGLPVSNSTLSPVLDSIPHDPDPATDAADATTNDATRLVSPPPQPPTPRRHNPTGPA